MNEIIELDENYFELVDRINSYQLKLVIDEMFLNENINLLCINDVIKHMHEAIKIKASVEDYRVLHIIIQVYAPVHYYNREYGFIIFLNISSVCSETDKNSNKKGYVYICSSDIGRYKIGASKNPENRMKSLSLGSSISHNLIYKIKSDEMFSLEKELQTLFKDKNIHSEWFDLDDSDLLFIKEKYISNLTISDMVA